MPTFAVDGQTLSFDVHGDGAPVVTLSNLAQNAMLWPGPVVPKLNGEGYKVIDVQHLGPTSDLDRIVGDMAALIEDKQWGPVHLWGYSQGGMFAQELALARPDLVRSAVLMATLGRRSAFMNVLSDLLDHMDEVRENAPEAAQ